jgi:pyruvate/2-oxoglutarate dehydrogenase complex dihydrolipoamide dehydrogenase (E3) component
MTFSHDVIVIGAGAAGLTAAGGCAMFGLKPALIEAGAMGGECLNNGCVPSKALIAAARRAAEARGGERLGVRIAEPEVDWAGVHAHVRDAIAAIAPHDSQERFEDLGCEVLRGHARLTGSHSVEVNGRTLTAPRIVIATGSMPAVPDIPGLSDGPFLTNENLFELTERPEHLLILGAGSIGMEMGQSFRSLGSDVTICDPVRPLGRDDPESVALLMEAMKREGVRFVEGQVVRVERRDSAIIAHLEGGDTLSGSHLLVATGRRARTGGMGLEELGVKMGANGIEVDARRRTSIPNIYAIGDCREGPRFTHVSGYEGGNVVLEIALGIPTKVNWRALPWCTYTQPEVAQIGMTEEQAREKYGAALKVVREAFDHNHRAIAEGSAEGHLKVMMKGKKVVGASICGRNAGELLLPFAQAITGKSSTFGLGSAIVPYPTRSEITKEAAFSAWEPTVFGAASKAVARTVSRMRKAF